MPNYGGVQNQTNHLEGVYAVPIGTIFSWAGTGGATLPVGYILCDGSPYTQLQYPGLYSVLLQTSGNGTMNNAGSPSGLAGTAFNVPDMRGRFVRGADNMSGPSGARNLDDVATNGRTAGNVGGSASGVGSKESDQFQSHWHNMYATLDDNGSDHGESSTYGTPTLDTGYQGRDVTSDPSFQTVQFGNETRPVNIAVVFIIKAV
jgi:hypothetical protein